ncbi:hypothetical protein LC085_08900 [Bacillus tianshenii]|uniref:CotY/CotZ family spore coat protein n=1 Tax=Sutcliffiella tianshenii TaxID=1463404 RepID=UPI001CD33D8F|nr:CotY/CotZ family spore coat protein [Bacillus tianshenii]MCA1320019.1 hypothetical protein [Bacillus tianshenii]
MKGNNPGYLADKLEQIHLIQSTVREPDWIKKLYLINPVKDTIPFLLYLKDGNPFYAHGNIGKRKGAECFSTPFFRIEELKDGYAILKLLKPSYFPDSNDQSICNVCNLEKSAFCIDVDLEMFGAIQLFDTEIVC